MLSGARVVCVLPVVLEKDVGRGDGLHVENTGYKVS